MAASAPSVPALLSVVLSTLGQMCEGQQHPATAEEEHGEVKEKCRKVALTYLTSFLPFLVPGQIILREAAGS